MLFGYFSEPGAGIYNHRRISPQEVEKYVTFPIEMAMTGLPGLGKLEASLTLAFPW